MNLGGLGGMLHQGFLGIYKMAFKVSLLVCSLQILFMAR